MVEKVDNKRAFIEEESEHAGMWYFTNTYI